MPRSFLRTRARRFSALTAAIAILSLGASGIAMADSITTFDGDTVKNPPNVQYAAAANAANHACSERGTAVPGTLVLAYNNAGNEHFTGSETLTVAITNPTAGITVTSSPNPASIPSTWTTGSTYAISLSTTVANTVPNGSYSVGVTVTGQSSQVTRSASYSVSITGCTITPSNTKPTVAVTGVSDGAAYDKGSVPTAMCHVTDTEDGAVADFAASLSSITGPNASDGIGSQTATCDYTDGGGLAADTAAATYTIGDPTAPTIGYTLDPGAPNGTNGWYNTDVTLTWLVADPQSPNSLVKTGCVDQNIVADQTTVTYTCSATSAGGSSGPVSVSIKRDASKPSIGHTLSPALPNANGWYKQDVTVTFTCSDGTSGIQSCTPASTLGEGGEQSVTGTAVDNAGNSQTDTVSGINIDKTAPTIGHTLSPSTPNANGWFNTDVTVSFSCEDALSGVTSCTVDGVSGNAKVLGEGANQSVTGTATDAADNTTSDTASGIYIDKTGPSVSLVGGPADGGTYYFGFVPAAPTCSASDALSGLDGSCSVSGYSTAVGTHTVTASATDKAGNTATASATYTVSAWTLKGFYQPVDMGGVFNTVKNGSTVPLKFELFAGPTELTSTAYISSFNIQKIGCTSGAPTDEVETLVTSGGTQLRYDTTGGQFVQNWKTPAKKGECYSATMNAADGSSITALFSLK